MMQTLPSKKVILLLGPPGSGKGTQALTLAKDLGIPHISTGDLFRENIRSGTPLGLQVKTSIEAGKLVSDEIVLKMLFDRVKAADCEHGFLLDGFPRTLAQAEALAKTIDQKNLIVLNLNVSDEIITRRAEGRLTCRSCGNVHNKYYSPPKHPDQCDKCGGELYQRADDTLSVVQERLRVYHTQSKPLIDFYMKRQLLTNVDGEKSRDAVYLDLKRAHEEKDSHSR